MATFAPAPTGACRDGKTLIIPRGASLPASCVKCGQPAQTPWVKKFAWHTPWLYFLIIFPGLLIYAIVAMIVQKKIELKIPLCDFHHAERKRWMIIGTICIVGCIPVGMIVSMALNFDAWVGWLVGFVMLIASVVFFGMSSLIKPTKIDDHAGEFKGAGEAFLNMLPPRM